MNEREFTRVRTAIPVRASFAGGLELTGTTRDVSLGGCFLATPTPPPEDTHGTVTLTLADGAIEVRAHAIAIRTRPDGVALHFLELYELESYEHLRNLIRYNADDPDQADHEFGSHVGLKRIEPGQPPPG